MTPVNEINLTRPDDWHVHLRDSDMLRMALPWTARTFARAIVMPNLDSPVRTASQAAAYRDRIRRATPPGWTFAPLMTCFLTDETDPADVAQGFAEGVFTAVKMYPARSTTNSAAGVTDVGRVYPVLERMQALGIPLLVHGEVVGSEVDVFDREKAFIDSVLTRLRSDFPALRIVFEHITTAEAVDYVQDAEGPIGATITVHHLMINRNAMFAGGIRPHMYCLPVAKRERHRLALRAAATSGNPRFFLGTDSAPHLVRDKESACGCAGISTAPVALELYAQVFEEEAVLNRLEAFASLNGARFYGLPPNSGTVTLAQSPWHPPETLPVGDKDQVRVFCPDGVVRWRLLAPPD
ncbi:dihydroorotase [Devosia geojensis]|uniref:Dihydroorotase n=1 Tax=Devosia geojensis TaxID=443610 RepID=A0A0F5FE67_9HYPH|nr:dihydroorotase [Devosia geojensis]